MSRHTLGQGVAVCLLAGLLGGCQAASQENSYPKDPLLLTKKPVDGKAAAATESVQTASAEPAAPPWPAPALASARRMAERSATRAGGPDPAAPPRENAPFQLIPGHSGGVPATTVAQNSATPAPGDTPGTRRAVVGTYGHAADYSWLQGVLDKHYHGHMDLRYCDYTVADKYGGKVLLDSDQRLSQFQEGDVIQVEGEIVTENDSSQKGWKHYPHYRIREVWLVQRKN